MMLQAGHYDPEAIRGCAEKVAVHWQQLMLKMEDRLKLVNASVAFYKTSEQVRLKPSRLHSRCVSGAWNQLCVSAGVQRVGEPGAGVSAGRRLVRQSRQTGKCGRHRPPAASDQQTSGAERSLPEGDRDESRLQPKSFQSKRVSARVVYDTSAETLQCWCCASAF